MAFARFMAAPAGRVLRIVVGLALIAGGYLLHSTAGHVILIVGFLPLAAGLFDWCIFAPLLGMPFRGSEIRKAR